jgi:hypothetical protein
MKSYEDSGAWSEGSLLVECKLCGATKPRIVMQKSNCNWYCNVCNAARAKNYRNESLKAREARAAYRKANKEKHADYVKNYRVRYPEKVRAKSGHDRALRALRVPKWLTKKELFEIQKLYALAVEMTGITGIEHQVDHILPLRGKTVSGLHVLNNLQILSREANLRKYNKCS